MAKPGKKRTAKRVLMERGSHHAKYCRDDEFDPGPEVPQMPATMTPAAKSCWVRVVSELAGKGILCRLDQQTLQRYCEHWALWEDACDCVARDGLTFTTHNKAGEEIVRPSPHVKIMKEQNEALLKIEIQFGMTPASRPEIPKPADRGQLTEFEKFLMSGDN